MSPIPGWTTRPRMVKTFRVRTRDTPYLWLHALDELKPGGAKSVRTEWRQAESEATLFASRTYAEEVATNNPGGWFYVAERLSAEPVK